MNNTNAIANAVRTLDTADHALRAIRPDLSGEFTSGLRSCATWADVAAVADFYVGAISNTLGAWDAHSALRELASVAKFAVSGAAPAPMQAALL